MKRFISILLIVMVSVTLMACKSKQEYDYDEEAVAATETNDENGKAEQIKTESETTPDKTVDKENSANKVSKETSDSTVSNENKPQSDTVNASNEQNNDSKISKEQPDTTSVQESKNEQDDSDEDDNIRVAIKIDKVPPVTDLVAAELFYNASDCFLGKIIDIEKVMPSEEDVEKYFGGKYTKPSDYSDSYNFRLNEDLDVFFPLNADLYVYTVEVTESAASIFVEKNTKIRVLSDVSRMTEPYKEGQTYIMKGTLYEYNGETVIRLYDQFRAKVNDDKTLIGLSDDFGIFEQLKTIDEFVNNETVQFIFKKKSAVSSEFSKRYGVEGSVYLNTDEVDQTAKQIIEDGKKAIIAGSGIIMKAETK